MGTREFAIIERYFKSLSHLSQHENTVIIGPGDDCAVLRVPDDMELCVSTDTLLEGVHFLPNSQAKVVVSRTMGANLSDLAAMGATPYAFLLAMTFPEAREGWLEDFSITLSEIIEKHQMPLVGGNLSKGPLSLTVTIMGIVTPGSAIKRSGGSVGDDIYVTGTLGDAAQGLALLRKGEVAGYLVDRYQFPDARIAAGQRLRGLAKSLIDISDGLVAEIGHLGETDALGAEIAAWELPLSKELVESVGQDSAIRMALFSGDDYELCFTADSADSDEIKAVSNSLNLPMTRIGVVTDDGKMIIRDDQGEPMRFSGAGYEHF
ncbi:MAG: thiamine-phosphate kinase [Candidatus Azotimanducaceae bacterium WSBS_2022_MAG_OTU7]